MRTSGPLPTPRADGGTPSRMDGVASDLRYVAVDRVTATVAEVMGPSEFVQWRAVDDGRGRPGEWRTLEQGGSLDERFEIRTGLGARVTLQLGSEGKVVVHRLSRARVERKIRSDGESQVGVTLYRGLMEVEGVVDGAAVHVRTPDQVFPVRGRVLFEYDAFRGTSAREFRPQN